MSSRRAASVLMAILVAVGLVSTGCGKAKAPGGSSQDQTLTILAASSLAKPFTAMAQTFEKQHPGTTVKLVLGSSATLAQMTVQHAPGDLLVTADRHTMDTAIHGSGVTGTATVFASNTMELVLPANNPAHLHRFADLNRNGVVFLTCVPSAPCGAVAQKLLAKDSITRQPASQEIDVKAVLHKVEAGGADAGLVYRTDVTAAGSKVTSLPIPGAKADPNTYLAAVTAASNSNVLARDWIRMLTSASGQDALHRAGFGPA
ncbi:MAG: molybdate ABC transporter substrate-binding protein [Actinomycetota bacterium]|nr:molybdate ABC transporter substrate-binding protein [Actinomycetota bacterium]